MPVAKIRLRKCQNCGIEYHLGVESSLHKYCTVKCRQAWHYRRWRSSGGRRCKTKCRAYLLKHHYGLSLEEYSSIRAEQGDTCKICRSPFSKSPHVDHCHTTGVVRGLLCQLCNQAVGLMRENVEAIRNMITYLQNSKTEATK